MDKESRSRFAALVNGVLEREKISQEQLGRLVGLSQSTISLWAKGEVKTMPTQAALLAFADYAGLTLDEVAIHLGLADRKKFNVAAIKVAIAQTNMDEAIAIQDAVTRRIKVLEAKRLAMESIGKAIHQHMLATGLSQAEIAAELKKRGFKHAEARLPEILNGDLAYKDELRAIALFLWGNDAKQDQVLKSFGTKNPALRPDRTTLNGASN